MISFFFHFGECEWSVWIDGIVSVTYVPVNLIFLPPKIDGEFFSERHNVQNNNK